MDQVFTDPADAEAVLERLGERDHLRFEITHLASKAQRLAKRSMYSLQRRKDFPDAEQLLLEAANLLTDLHESHGDTRARDTVGAWRAGAEEFLEGLFFLQFVRGERLDFSRLPMLTISLGGTETELPFDDEEVFGALSDLTGEIQRQMQMWIVDGEYEKAVDANRCIAQVCEILNLNSSGGNLRNKVDQANRNLQHSDARLTDLKIRGLLGPA